MSKKNLLADIRREYGQLTLNKKNAKPSPIAQFECWFEDILKTNNPDPTAMILATVDEKGRPDTRIVLLKGILEEKFIFYTNYESAKALQLENNQGFCALNFHWPRMARQVRVRGCAQKLDKNTSDAYFLSRPQSSQLSALASPQSQVIESRSVLENRLNQLIEAHGQALVMRPEHWGGYAVEPFEIEFWQGRDNRLHDRLRYRREDGIWVCERLAP